MNIFRDLVEELKEENLLEETVIDPLPEKRDLVPLATGIQDNTPVSEANPARAATNVESSTAGSTGKLDPAEDIGLSSAVADHSLETERVEVSNDRNSIDTPISGGSLSQEFGSQVDALSASGPDSSIQSPGEIELPAETPAADQQDSGSIPKIVKPRSPEEERHFYRQRAMDEVTGLQLVEHVLSGVEREQMKSAPKTFDDLAVKRSLHEFLKVADDINSPEHATAEFQLMQETENWCSALSRRDRNVSVAHLRRYCETTRPSLSSQAMISLARFYRNSPYSEAVRSKFDLVFTKLFTKDMGQDSRAVVFKNEELIKHIQELYADWSSIPLYSTDEDDSGLIIEAMKFQDFVVESKNADSFDELVRNDFFKRLKVFKEKTNENFFAPIVVAAAIESNVAVGNRYVELIELERQNQVNTGIGEKYGVEHDVSISDATSKTLELLEILQNEKPEPVEQKVQVQDAAPKKKRASSRNQEEQTKSGFSIAGVTNKWLIIATAVMIMVTCWYFFVGSTPVANEVVKGNGTAMDFQLEGSGLIDKVHSAKISKDTLFGITRDSWTSLSPEAKTELVKKAVALGDSKGFTKVHFLDSKGQTTAFGSKTEIKIN